MTDIAALQDRFIHTMQRLGAQTGIDAAFDQLIEDYQHPPRFYHTIDHVKDVLDHLDFAAAHVDELKTLTPVEKQKFLDTVELAIWYHDIVYDATLHDNEAQSADNMVDAAQKMGIAADIIDLAKEAILITAHHADAKTLAEKIIVDCDLHTLGVPWDKFFNNSALIRKEYAHVADDLYVVGRANALMSFLGENGIYKTVAFRGRYEDKAQENIKRLVLNAATKNPVPPSFKK